MGVRWTSKQHCVVTKSLISQDVIWMLNQGFLDFMDVKRTSKQRCVFTWLTRVYFGIHFTKFSIFFFIMKRSNEKQNKSGGGFYVVEAHFFVIQEHLCSQLNTCNYSP